MKVYEGGEMSEMRCTCRLRKEEGSKRGKSESGSITGKSESGSIRPLLGDHAVSRISESERRYRGQEQSSRWKTL